MFSAKLSSRALLLSCMGVWIAPMFGQTEKAGGDSGSSISKSFVAYTQNTHDPPMKYDVVPVDYRRGARLFVQKCSTCHSLNRTFEKEDLSADEWTDIVYRMQDMASSHLDPSQSEPILKFVTWRSQQQRKGSK